MKFCSELGIKQIFATYNNPKGNAETERMIRTIKEEVICTHEFDSLQEAKTKIKEFIQFYNSSYPYTYGRKAFFFNHLLCLLMHFSAHEIKNLFPPEVDLFFCMLFQVHSQVLLYLCPFQI